MSDETADTSSAPEAPTEHWPDRTLKQLMEQWIEPEIKARQARGELPVPAQLQAAQILWPPGAPFIVRLNNEIRGVAVLKAPIDKETGGPKLDGPEVEIERFELAPDELDASHATLFVINNKWRLIFNFQTRRAHAGQLLDKAEEFLATAEWCHAQGKVSACVDNLFSACELTSKAQLIVHHLLEAKSRKHKAIATQLNQQGRIGNVPQDFLDLFNQLQHARPEQRYEVFDPSSFQVDVGHLEIVRRELGAFRTRIGAKVTPEG